MLGRSENEPRTIALAAECITTRPPMQASITTYITTEHLLRTGSRPIVVIYISLLFQMMFKYNYVPDDFGCGIITSLVKYPESDTGNSSNSNNSRDITVKPGDI